jgi:uncharacterized RDD family membrane protein YckC
MNSLQRILGVAWPLMEYTQSLARRIQVADSPFGPADVQCTPRRVFAYIIDSVILGAVGVAVSVVAGWWYSTTVTVNQFGQYMPVKQWHVNVGPSGYLALAGISFGYFVVMEWALGWTVGKVIFGLRVVDFSGGQISIGQSLVRNVLRIVDGFFGGLVGLAFILTSVRRQRLGDRASGALVVRAL